MLWTVINLCSMNRKTFDLEAQEKRLGLNFGKQQVSKRLYNVGDFSPHNLFWESTLPGPLRQQYKTQAARRKLPGHSARVPKKDSPVALPEKELQARRPATGEGKQHFEAKVL